MSASLPDTPTGREPSKLTNASVPTAPVQASELDRPSAAGETSYKIQDDPSAVGEASHETLNSSSAAGATFYRKPGGWIAVALTLGVTFWLYAKPGVVVMLADQLWSCF